MQKMLGTMNKMHLKLIPIMLEESNWWSANILHDENVPWTAGMPCSVT